MKREWNIVIGICIFLAFWAQGAEAQHVALKTNLLYDATSTFNLGVETKLGRKTTLDLSGNYNPWTFSDNKKIKHWMIQPEFRLWTCEAFNGQFFGLHTHYAAFNIGGIGPWGVTPNFLEEYRYEGWTVGVGISYGWHWMLSAHWGLEASVGAGYSYLKYDKYRCQNCGKLLENNRHKHYIGPTKIALSLVYLIK